MKLAWLRDSTLQHGVATILALSTGARYVLSHTGWEPNEVWLMFIAALFGIGAANDFWNKHRNGNGNSNPVVSMVPDPKPEMIE